MQIETATGKKEQLIIDEVIRSIYKETGWAEYQTVTQCNSSHDGLSTIPDDMSRQMQSMNIDLILTNIHNHIRKNQDSFLPRHQDAPWLPKDNHSTQPEGDRSNMYFRHGFSQSVFNGRKPVFKVKPEYHVHELTRFHDRDFIVNAYKGILNREPDEVGLGFYLNELRRAAKSKIRILGSLRFSSEGRARKVKIKGLVARLGADFFLYLPLLGYVARMIVAIIALPRSHRRLSDLQALLELNVISSRELSEADREWVKAETHRITAALDELTVSRAEKSVVSSIYNKLLTIDTEKAGKDWVEDLHTQTSDAITRLVEGKMDKQLTTLLENRLIQLIGQKADKDWVEELNTQTGEAIDGLTAGKVDKRSVTAVTERLIQLIGQKADLSLLEDLNSQTTQALADLKAYKLDRAMADALEERLIYLIGLKADLTLPENLNIQQTLAHPKAPKLDKAMAGVLEERLIQLIGHKTDPNFVNELGARTDEASAEHETLTPDMLSAAILEDRLVRLIGQKADKDWTEEVTARLNETVVNLRETKADQDVIEGLEMQLREFDYKKVEKNRIDELARLTEGKTDRQAVVQITEERLKIFAEKHLANRPDAEVAKEIKRIALQLKAHKNKILDQDQRLRRLLEEARKCLPGPMGPQELQNLLKEEDHILDALYVDFEDKFRGLRDDIKNRQRFYLPYVLDINAGTLDLPILDIGCGRGEWLELCQEEDMLAKGVDINRIMIKTCQELGLDVECIDALEYLRQQEAASFGVITGFHIVEHLPSHDLVTLLDESFRVLKPGGMIIFETPNPENVLVGSCTFYSDISHNKPIPPETLKFLVESRGFVDSLIFRLSPLNLIPEDLSAPLKDIVDRFNMEQDYSVMARKV
ncbi:MAG: methyltransferase domain-containing protein [Deltaproteobacteria bacterium]|nr:methyltransferase domain-containing protein [Deltaproteobacteria bacterium]